MERRWTRLNSSGALEKHVVGSAPEDLRGGEHVRGMEGQCVPIFKEKRDSMFVGIKVASR